MRAVAFQSPEVSQPNDAVDQLLYSDRLLTAKEVARLLEGLSLWPIHHGYPYRCASPPAGSSANPITAKSHFVST